MDEKIEKYFLASIVESSQDSIISVDFDMRITSWNSAAAELYGYEADEVIGQPLTRLTRDEDLKMIMTKVKEVKRSKRLEVFDTNRVGKGGNPLYLEVVMSPVKDDRGNVIGVSTIARDVSLRRLAEKASFERELLRKIVTAQEDERARLARNLHDELGQGVTALRFMLKSAKEKCSDPDFLRDIKEMKLVVEEMDRNVDFISWELRPAALDTDSSLTAEINNFTRQWSRHTGIPVSRIAPLKGEQSMLDVDTHLYRIAQEALNNIQKHAKATEVDVSLKKRGEFIVLVISDDGKGFSTKSRKKTSKGFGLIGMKERADLIGASLEIESSPGNGTTVYVRVPLRAESKVGHANAQTNASQVSPA